MQIIMVKKILSSGEACPKCLEATERLQREGAWDRIDSVLEIREDAPGEGEGAQIAEVHGVRRAPFFVIREGEEERIILSVMQLIRQILPKTTPPSLSPGSPTVATLAQELEGAEPQAIVRRALEVFGRDLAIAFSGAEDVAVIHMAAQTGLPFSVFSLDTGRLHPETLTYLETVRKQYGLDLEVVSPDAGEVETLVREKGLFSFFEDGHQECCGIRKVRPLRKTLSRRMAWMTGQRADQNPATRGHLDVVEEDGAFEGRGAVLMKFNPLAQWTSTDVWSFLQREGVPVNPLHAQGFRSIGCAPCTRPVTADQHEREGRWWWEDALSKECGLHVRKGS